MLCSSGIFSELEICYMAQFQSSQKSRPCDSSLGSFSICRIGNSGIRFNHDSCLDLIFFHWNLFASGDEAFYICIDGLFCHLQGLLDGIPKGQAK